MAIQGALDVSIRVSDSSPIADALSIVAEDKSSGFSLSHADWILRARVCFFDSPVFLVQLWSSTPVSTPLRETQKMAVGICTFISSQKGRDFCG
jgi:hypothetical protein